MTSWQMTNALAAFVPCNNFNRKVKHSRKATSFWMVEPMEVLTEWIVWVRSAVVSILTLPPPRGQILNWELELGSEDGRTTSWPSLGIAQGDILIQVQAKVRLHPWQLGWGRAQALSKGKGIKNATSRSWFITFAKACQSPWIRPNYWVSRSVGEFCSHTGVGDIAALNEKEPPEEAGKDDCLQMDSQGGLRTSKQTVALATSSHQSRRCFAACRSVGLSGTSSDLLFVYYKLFILYVYVAD